MPLMKPKSGFTRAVLKNIEATPKALNEWEQEVIAAKDYLEIYRTEALVRECIDTLAYFATSKGYFITLEPVAENVDIKQYEPIRKEIERMCYDISLENMLNIGARKMFIYGVAPFEIVKDDFDNIVRLLPLQATEIVVLLNENYMLQGYKYGNVQYEPDEIFYLVNNPLEANYTGFSRIEPIVDAVRLKKHLEFDIKEAALRLWSPIALFQMDTTGMTPEEEEEELTKFAEKLKPGNSVIYNKSVQASVVKMSPNIQALIYAWEAANEEIIGNFGVPKALLAREKTMNRATLEFSIKAMYESQIEGLQAYLKREVERQLYSQVIKKHGLEDKIRAIHNWKPYRKTELVSLTDAVIKLVENNIIGPEKAWELLALGSYVPTEGGEMNDRNQETGRTGVTPDSEFAQE